MLLMRAVTVVLSERTWNVLLVLLEGKLAIVGRSSGGREVEEILIIVGRES